MANIEGNKAIVTGGALGIGFATATRLLTEGCDVTIWDFNADALKDAESKLKALNKGKVYAYVCDVTDKKRVKKLSADAIRDMGRIDFLVNNAGIERHGRFCDKPLEEWERLTAVNLNSIYYTTHAILPGMLARNSGHIVNVSSAAGIVGVADLATYCATKWAVWGLTESLRMEARMDNRKVRFSSIHPFFLKQGLFEGSRVNFLGEIIIPRISTHDRVARAIVNKAIKGKRNTVKIPVTLHLAVIIRGLVPDFIMNFIITRLLGVGSGMENWVGYGK
jgi:all-trans-retinol dehydrogenase (NAD+)